MPEVRRSLINDRWFAYASRIDPKIAKFAKHRLVFLGELPSEHELLDETRPRTSVSKVMFYVRSPGESAINL